MAEDPKNAGSIAAVSAIVVAIVGLITAFTTGFFNLKTKTVEVSASHPDTQSPRQLDPIPTAPSSSTAVVPQTAPAPAPTSQRDPPPQTTTSDQKNGPCYLPGDWELSMNGTGDPHPFDIPVRFSGRTISLYYGSEVRTSCTVRADSVDIVRPPVDFNSNNALGGFLLVMPTHYERQSDNTYLANELGIDYSLHRQ